ncbi:MAG: hypothetical protein QXP53_02475 [Candidatus Pacearchaeota archaeon]
MSRQNKKGQAAMEFLMTYGWAILIAIIAIAALIAFGVLNVGKTAANICTLTAPLEAKGCYLQEDSTPDQVTLSVTVYNGGDSELTVQSVSLTGKVDANKITCSKPVADTLPSEQEKSITVAFSTSAGGDCGAQGTDSIVAGKRFKDGTLTIVTDKGASTGAFTHTIIP